MLSLRRPSPFGEVPSIRWNVRVRRSRARRRRTNAASHLAECSDDDGAVALYFGPPHDHRWGWTMAPGVGCISNDRRFCHEHHRLSHNEKSSQYVQDRNIPMR